MKKLIKIFISSRNDEDCKRIFAILSAQKDFRIVGVECDEAGTVIKTARLKPDVLILDLQRPGICGHELAPVIHRRSPDTAIVMLCDIDNENYAGIALKAGITGFLLKEKDMDKLAPVVKIVFHGGYYISSPILIKAFNILAFRSNFPGQIIEQDSEHQILSPTERSIVTDIVHGLSYEEIAKHLHFSVGTIKNCMSTIKRKTKLKNRVQIAVYMLIYGYINFEHLRFNSKTPWADEDISELEPVND